MNLKPIDPWSITHFIFGIFISIYLLNRGFSIILAFYLIISFELLEHLIIGDLLFNWKKTNKREIPLNAMFDIIFGTIGAVIGSLL